MFTTDLGNLRYVIYTYEKVKMISIPVKEYVLVFSADDIVNTDDLLEKVSQYIQSIESELLLYPPSNIINKEKKEIVRNLHDSGIAEDMIADQLDLDINTVKMLIQEISN
jgi:DNA-binding NarL/FixJ family response regulator